MDERLPPEIVELFFGTLWESDPDGFLALAMTCSEYYETYLKPCNEACEDRANEIFEDVWQSAVQCLPQHALRYFDDDYYGYCAVPRSRRDGIYRCADQCECSAKPWQPHLHSARVRYTRNGRDIDLWECLLDDHEWKIMG